MRRVLRALAVGVVLTAVVGCPTSDGDLSNMVAALGGVVYDNGALFDFGAVAPGESTAVQVTVDLENAGTMALTVASVSITGTGAGAYEITGVSTPLVIEPGASVGATLTFHPIESATYEAALAVTLDAAGVSPYVVSLAGEGNYPPTARLPPARGYLVAGAGLDEVNGDYPNPGDGTFGRDAGDYVIGQVNFASGGNNWAIAAEGTELSAPYRTDNNVYPNPPLTGWYVNPTGTTPAGVEPAPVLVGPGFPTLAYSGNPIQVRYHYEDPEGDEEDAEALSVQWYRSTSDQGPWTEIPGATDLVYTPFYADDVGHYLRVVVTPAAQTGVTTGTPAEAVTPNPVPVE